MIENNLSIAELQTSATKLIADVCKDKPDQAKSFSDWLAKPNKYALCYIDDKLQVVKLTTSTHIKSITWPNIGKGFPLIEIAK